MRFCLFKPAATSAFLNVRKRLWHGPESCLVFKQMWNQSIYGRGRSYTLSGWVLHMPASYKHTMRHRRVLSWQRICWFYPGSFVLCCCLEGRVGSQMHCGRCPLAAFPCLNTLKQSVEIQFSLALMPEGNRPQVQLRYKGTKTQSLHISGQDIESKHPFKNHLR